MLWIEEYHQYAMWALGSDGDVRKGERPREPGGLLVRADPIDRASRLVEGYAGPSKCRSPMALSWWQPTLCAPGRSITSWLRAAL